MKKTALLLSLVILSASSAFAAELSSDTKTVLPLVQTQKAAPSIQTAAPAAEAATPAEVSTPAAVEVKAPQTTVEQTTAPVNEVENASEVKTDEVKTDEVKASELKADETQTDEIKADEAKAPCAGKSKKRLKRNSK